MSPAASLWVRAQLDEKPMPPAARLASSSARIAARSSAVASPLVARSPITTRRIVEWPTRKPALGASVPSMLVEVLAEAAPVPRHAFGERGERHALDPRQHAHQVVAVLGLERRDREAAVAADHGRDAVQRRRRERGVPERPARRSACGCRRSRARRPCRRRRSSRVALVVESRRSPRCARRRSRRRPRRPGAPVPSTTVPLRMIRVEHGPTIVQRAMGGCTVPAGLPSSPGRHAGIGAAIARRPRRRKVRRSRWLPAASNPAPAVISPGRCGRPPTHRRRGRYRVPDRGRPLRPGVRPRRDRRAGRDANSARSTSSSTTRPRASTSVIDETSERRLRVAYEVNVITPYLSTKAVVPGMRERGGGWIVNITSAIVDTAAARQSAAGALVDVRAEQGRARPADRVVRDRTRGPRDRGERARSRARGRDTGRDRGDGPAANGANRST